MFATLTCPSTPLAPLLPLVPLLPSPSTLSLLICMLQILSSMPIVQAERQMAALKHFLQRQHCAQALELLLLGNIRGLHELAKKQTHLQTLGLDKSTCEKISSGLEHLEVHKVHERSSSDQPTVTCGREEEEEEESGRGREREMEA